MTIEEKRAALNRVSTCVETAVWQISEKQAIINRISTHSELGDNASAEDALDEWVEKATADLETKHKFLCAVARLGMVALSEGLRYFSCVDHGHGPCGARDTMQKAHALLEASVGAMSGDEMLKRLETLADASNTPRIEGT